MAGLSLKSFAWRRVSNGYRLIEKSPHSERIFANSGREVRYLPFAQADNLYAIFAQVRTKDDLLNFVTNYGPLTSGGFNKEPREPEDMPLEIDLKPLTHGYTEEHFKISDQIDQLAWNYDIGGEEVEEDLKEAARFRRWLSTVGNSKDVRSLIGEKRYIFILEPMPAATAKNGFELRVSPGDFSDALRFQLFQKLTGADIRSCEHCGEWFEVGAGTGRRKDAKFCSDQHRILANSAKRSTGR